jgi:hypothetical protein
MMPVSRVSAWLAQPGSRVCILSAEAAAKVSGATALAEAKGWNFAKGKRLTLVALGQTNP